MSYPISAFGGYLGFLIGLKNTNLIEVTEYFLQSLVKFYATDSEEILYNIYNVTTDDRQRDTQHHAMTRQAENARFNVQTCNTCTCVGCEI